MIFSHDEMRPGQKELAHLIAGSLESKKHVLAHAPTGLGKTAAALCPALDLALKRDLFVVFLTSRHTQHKIVLSTLKKLKEKHDINAPCVSIIGKKWMCAQDNVHTMLSGDFAEYCRSMVEKDTCHFYMNAKKKAKHEFIVDRLSKTPLSAEEVSEECVKEEVCPYEISLKLAESAKVVIADYFYFFNPRIRNVFLTRTKKKMEQAILVVDEAHNLPGRVRELLTSRLTSRLLGLAIKEANRNNLDLPVLAELKAFMENKSFSLNGESECLLNREDLIKAIERIKQFDEVIAELELASDSVLQSKKRSFISSVARFLDNWAQEGDGFSRVISKTSDNLTLSVVCLDPALLSKDVFDQCHSGILMSGTLSPVSMYSDVLGIDNHNSKAFPSPFPKKNRLCLIVPKTTTKYSMRTDQQYTEIAKLCADMANSIPGCVMLFFPSYFLRDKVAQRFVELYEKTMFQEIPGMSKSDKQDLLERFSGYKERGAALLAVASGSFGEGIDLPGILKGVLVVGLPLDRPSLETKELITYYDKKFGRGWDYGYTLPAMTKTIQNAGRCIRSEKDTGVLAFIDERYAWPRYKDCFPPDWNTDVTLNYREKIIDFFKDL